VLKLFFIWNFETWSWLASGFLRIGTRNVKGTRRGVRREEPVIGSPPVIAANRHSHLVKTPPARRFGGMWSAVGRKRPSVRLRVRSTPMLVLTRKKGETVVIANGIRIRVVSISGKHVRLAIEAPREIPVDREEIWRSKREEAGTAEPQLQFQ
jgi:carbon storage regulator